MITEILIVAENLLVGTIRDGFSQWTDLRFVDFRVNSFSGTLPTTIFDSPSIEIIYFADNRLEGTIPDNYDSSPVLRDLYLENNLLSGTIPEIEPGTLAELSEFLVHGNQFTGTMPPSICQLTVDGVGVLDDLWADCSPDASPRLECDLPGCCTLCFP